MGWPSGPPRGRRPRQCGKGTSRIRLFRLIGNHGKIQFRIDGYRKLLRAAQPQNRPHPSGSEQAGLAVEGAQT